MVTSSTHLLDFTWLSSKFTWEHQGILPQGKNCLQIDAEEDTQYLYNYQNALDFYKVQSLDDQDQQTVIKIANRMYAAADVEIKPQFKNVTNQYFKSTIEEVNFFNSEETVYKTNNFVNNATNGLIKKAFKEISPNTRLLLLNAIYFKGAWKYQFPEASTNLRDFHIDNSTQTQVSTMGINKELRHYYFEELEFDVLDLPYENETMSMIIILPDKTTDVLKIEKKLQNFETQLLFEKLQSASWQRVQVALPKFEMSSNVPKMIESFKSLGVSSLFDNNADLSNISEEELFVSNIEHKSFVKVSIS